MVLIRPKSWGHGGDEMRDVKATIVVSRTGRAVRGAAAGGKGTDCE